MFNFDIKTKGFTLIELMVTISIIGILSAVVYAGFGEARAQARDKVRMATLKEMQLAIELYKAQNGRYPEGCNNPGNWSNSSGIGNYKCPTATEPFIKLLAPDYIPELPKDPLHSSAQDDQGYLYLTDPTGSAYKLLAYGTYEAGDIDLNNEYARCPSSCSATDMCDPDQEMFAVTLAVYSSPGEYVCI